MKGLWFRVQGLEFQGFRMAIAEGCRVLLSWPQCPANHVCNYYGMPINLLHKRIQLSKASRNQGKQSTANLAYQVCCWWNDTVSTTVLLLYTVLPLYYYRHTTVLLYYCTTVILLYYCTTIVLLLYYYGITTVLLYYYCTTHHCTAPGLRRGRLWRGV